MYSNFIGSFSTKRKLMVIRNPLNPEKSPNGSPTLGLNKDHKLNSPKAIAPDKEPKLSYRQKKILADWLELQAATPLQFEMRTNRIGQEHIVDELEALEKLGYVKSDQENSDNDPQSAVFYPAWKTRWRRIIGLL